MNPGTTTAVNIEVSRKRVPFSGEEPQTLGELFLKAAKKYPLDNALNYKKDGAWHSISSAEMVARIENTGAGLYSLGVPNIGRGDRAAILSANCPEWTLADAACQLTGIIDVPIYTTLSPSSICYILRDSGAKVLFIENKRVWESVREILPECPALEKLVFFDSSDIAEDIGMSLSELENAGAELITKNRELMEELSRDIKPDDTATLIYTSGTTGEPKGVMLSHMNLISNVLDAGARFDFSGHDRPLSVLPLSHVFERTGMYLYIHNGMRVHYAQSIEKVPENLQEVRPTLFVGVPRIFEKVYAQAKLKAGKASRLKERIFDWAIEVAKEQARLKTSGQAVPRMLAIKHSIADHLIYKKFREFFGGELRHCISGGAALSDEIALIFTGAGVSIMQGYGLTETSPVISSNNIIDWRLGTVGKPIPNVEVRIAADGEIEARGPNVMLGYYNKPEATREAFTADGWFRTGDIGALDADGFLKITDRKKELFKTSGGKYIAPAPIEQMIRSSRFVSQVVLIGSERKFASALIVPNFEQLESYAHLKGLHLKTAGEFCADPKIKDLLERQVEETTQGLAQFESVKKIALMENEFTVEGGELTPTLKIKRRVIDEKYKDVIDGIYGNK
jgi:long-chain acyl-CoA synthetase